MSAPVRTRFAPSPTGMLHIGGVRTALFNLLFARRHGGQFLLRIEDTDRERSTPEAVQVILDGLNWMDLNPDEEPLFQSTRIERHRAAAEGLLAEGRAYRCYCTPQELTAMREAQQAKGEKPRYDGRCRHRSDAPQGAPYVVRLANPTEGETVVDDLVQGRVVFANTELDDLILLRSDGSPTYMLAVVVDDADMGITHVIRGDDHLNNTPRQMQIYRALGLEPPQFGHISLIHGADGAKLSKRHGAVAATQYRQEGYLPEALVNYLVRLGWSHGDQEIFSRQELEALFDLDHVGKSASSFNPEKLLWLNAHYLRERDPETLIEPLWEQLALLGQDVGDRPRAWWGALIRELQPRSETLRQVAEGVLPFLAQGIEIDPAAQAKHLKGDAAPVLSALIAGLSALTVWEREAIGGVFHGVAERLGVKMGKIAQPARVAVTGRTVSPGIYETLELMGRQTTLQRMQAAVDTVTEEQGV